MKRVITYGTFDQMNSTGMKNRRSVIFLTKNVNSFWKLYVMSIW